MSEKISNASERSSPSLAYLRECFAYDPETGALTWCIRPRQHFATDRGWKIANSRCAGKVAGTVDTYGHLQMRLNGRTMLAHRIAFALHHAIELEDVPPILDHRNGDGVDNRGVNLRAATIGENAKNRKIGTNNSTGAKGVSFHKGAGRWQAHIQVDGCRKHLGLFDTVEAAGAAYDAAASQHFGEFARAAA